MEPYASALLALAVIALLLLLSHVWTRAAWFSLRGAVVVITGGSSGIGKATAAAVLARGGHVALIARRADVLAGAWSERGPVRAPERSPPVCPRCARYALPGA